MKRCFKCQQVQPLDNFYRHARMADGRLNKCRECTKRDSTQHRLDKIEQYRAYDRMRASMPHRVALRTRICKEYQAKNPRVTAAHSAVHRALKAGKLEKWPCMICGGASEAHHPDYDRPLDVVWLCSAHHKQAHALGKRLGSGK